MQRALSVGSLSAHNLDVAVSVVALSIG